MSVALAILGAATVIGALATLVALALEDSTRPGRARRRPADATRALRRGAGIGVLVAALATLRALDGLTVVTGGFVLAGFLLAEVVVGTRRTARSG